MTFLTLCNTSSPLGLCKHPILIKSPIQTSTTICGFTFLEQNRMLLASSWNLETMILFSFHPLCSTMLLGGYRDLIEFA